MKKIIVIIICFIFVYGGCKANINDACKMINNINKVGNEEIFDDYYIKGISYNNDSVFNYELIKDNDNYYIKIEKDDFYIIKNNNSYHLYENINNEKKHYKLDEDIDTILNQYTSRMSLNTNMNEMHKNIAIHLENLLSYCNENKAICRYSKSLFGKADLEILQQTEISKRVSKYSIDNGKITKINSEYIEDSIYLNTIIEIDYNNQNLNKLNKSDYKLVNKNS
ncbi:MAG: hypothetical protein IKJ30_04780 [Bacilli bacterium]|nr:hypothetical protein [Bacilli bacterium]